MLNFRDIKHNFVSQIFLTVPTANRESKILAPKLYKALFKLVFWLQFPVEP